MTELTHNVLIVVEIFLHKYYLPSTKIAVFYAHFERFFHQKDLCPFSSRIYVDQTEFDVKSYGLHWHNHNFYELLTFQLDSFK